MIGRVGGKHIAKRWPVCKTTLIFVDTLARARAAFLTESKGKSPFGVIAWHDQKFGPSGHGLRSRRLI